MLDVCLVPYSQRPPSPLVEPYTTPHGGPFCAEGFTTKEAMLILVEDLLKLARFADAARSGPVLISLRGCTPQDLWSTGLTRSQ